MRNMFADTFYSLAQDDPKLMCVVADISPAGSIQKFREEFPDRFINVGVSEQIMIGMCAGLAQEGLKPFAYTIATFALYRPFEFIRDDLAYQNLPVTIVGIGGGLVYSTLGATHHAMEDIAIASAIPNMSVIAPCDPLETMYLTYFCAKREKGGPIYMRLGKAGEPTLTDKCPEPIIFGKLRHLRQGDDVCIIAYGTIMWLAYQLADDLKSKGVSVSLISCHTLAPLDRSGLDSVLASHRKVIVIEEMIEDCGLGMKVKAIATENNALCDVVTFGLKREFKHVYGSHDQLLQQHGLTYNNIVKVLK